MPAKPADGDRRSPAPHAATGEDAGDTTRKSFLPPHRQVMAALLAASALVPLSQPAEAEERPVSEQGSVALKAFVRQPVPAESLRAMDPEAELTELNRMKRSVVAEEQRELRAELRAAERRAAEARAEAKREAAERARERREAARREAARPDYVRPAVGALTSGFGARWGTSHEGIDIANAIGTPIVTVADGTVIEAGPASGFGLWVQVRHDDGTVTVYGHMNEITTWAGQRVQAGQQIATMGDRGYSTGSHLHFEVWQGGSAKVDPLAWLTARGVSV